VRVGAHDIVASLARATSPGCTPRLALRPHTRRRGCHSPGAADCPCENLPLLTRVPVMDIEHINQIGNSLADLSARTDALRGYL